MALKFIPEGHNLNPPENSSARIKFFLNDFDDNPVALASITSCKMTIRDRLTNGIINNRDQEEVRLQFDGTTGLFVMILGPDDNIIVSEDKKTDEEIHEILFEIVVDSAGTPIYYNEETWLTVRDINNIGNN